MQADAERYLRRWRELVPAFDAREVIHSFAGARAKSDRNDWIIEASAVPAAHGRFIHAAVSPAL